MDGGEVAATSATRLRATVPTEVKGSRGDSNSNSNRNKNGRKSTAYKYNTSRSARANKPPGETAAGAALKHATSCMQSHACLY